MLQIDLTFLVTFAVVWILVFILTRIFWRPMLKTVSERKDQIDGDNRSARAHLSAVDESVLRIESSLKAARIAADRVRDELEVESLKERSRLVAEAGALAKRETDRAKVELQGELTRLRTELDAKAVDLSALIEKRLLGR